MGTDSQIQPDAPTTMTTAEQVMSSFRDVNLLAKVSTLYIASLLFIAPLKLGMSLNNTGIAFFPLSLIEWQIATWPPFLMPLFTGVALLLVIAAAPPDWRVFRGLLHAWLPLVILLIAALIGLVKTTELDFALGFVWHMLGILVMAIAVILHLAVFPKSRWIFLIAIASAAVFSSLQGWHQVLWGFDQSRKDILEMAQQGELVVNANIISRMDQHRAFASFTYPNSYAAHLVATAPIALYLVWQGARHVSPPRFSQLLLTFLTAVVTLGAFVLSGSRAAIVAVVMGLATTAVIHGWRYRAWLRQRLFLIVWAVIGCILAGSFMYVLVQQGRTLSSLSARLDYYRSAWLMFLQAPLTGMGMGEFFPWHLRLKPPGAEDTRLVHNLVLHFLSQTGIVGGLGAIYFLAGPILIWYRSLRGRLSFVSTGLWLAIFVGWASWAIHSLADFNLQIPGTMITVVVLPLLAINLPASGEAAPAPKRAIPGRIALAMLALLTMATVWRLPGERAYQIYYNALSKPMMVETRAQQVEALAKVFPYSPYPWDWLGKEALRQKNYDLAIWAFTNALKRTPHRAAFYAYLTRAQMALHQYDAAQENLEQTLIWYPYKADYLALQDELENARK